jgi:hypothetical protein
VGECFYFHPSKRRRHRLTRKCPRCSTRISRGELAEISHDGACRYGIHFSVVPLSQNLATALAEVSDLGIELDPRHWRRRKKLADRIHSAVKTIHSGFLRYSFGSEKDSVRGRIYRKLFEATFFFRRSFHRSDTNWSAVVSVAVAFEMLLTDGYAPNVRTRVVRRTRNLLRGVPGMRSYTKAVHDLYAARGAIVHAGTTQQAVDLQRARRAFVHAFVAIAEAMPNLSPASVTPMKELAGDSKE